MDDPGAQSVKTKKVNMKKLTLANALIIIGLAAIVTYLVIHASQYGFQYVISSK